MKYLKENIIKKEKLKNDLEEFFKKYKDYKKRLSYPDNDITTFIRKRNSFKEIPSYLYNEIEILLFLYCYDFYWKSNINSLDNNIRKNVKEYIILSILEKIYNNSIVYKEIKSLTDKYIDKNIKFSLNQLYYMEIELRYIFNVLYLAEKRTPTYIKDTEKYNI